MKSNIKQINKGEETQIPNRNTFILLFFDGCECRALSESIAHVTYKAQYYKLTFRVRCEKALDQNRSPVGSQSLFDLAQFIPHGHN